MINDQEEYEVEQVISHQYYGHKKTLQYLIHWKGYSVADNTWELADQVFMDALMKAYHRKHPLEGGNTPTFTMHLQAALAKSHWCPLTNFGVTGPATKQDCIGAPKISAPTVPSAPGTMKNMSTPMHHFVAQHTKLTAEADALEWIMSKRSIHRALVKFFTCLPSPTPMPSPTVPIAGWITVVCCNMPLNASRPPATTIVTLTCGKSASMAKSASLSPRASPTSTPLNVALLKLLTVPGTKIGCFPQLWRTLSNAQRNWNRPSPSSVTVQLPAKWEGDVMVWLVHMPENYKLQGHVCIPNDGIRQTSWGQIRRC